MMYIPTGSYLSVTRALKEHCTLHARLQSSQYYAVSDIRKLTIDLKNSKNLTAVDKKILQVDFVVVGNFDVSY